VTRRPETQRDLPTPTLRRSVRGEPGACYVGSLLAEDGVHRGCARADDGLELVTVDLLGTIARPRAGSASSTRSPSGATSSPGVAQTSHSGQTRKARSIPLEFKMCRFQRDMTEILIRLELSFPSSGTVTDHTGNSLPTSP
jgi:hypothetical protein